MDVSHPRRIFDLAPLGVDNVEAVDDLAPEREHLRVADVESQVRERVRDAVQNAERIGAPHLDDGRVT